MLSETQSWDLFCHHAFPFRKKDHIPHDDLKGIAENIARECKGLPLALKVIGTAMSNKRTPFEWNTALDRLRRQEIIDDDQDKKLIQVLRLSYDALESMETFAGKVRECFLYFGAFVEDDEINVESLMNCWVGEGLLKNDTSPLNQTYMVLGVLIGSCLVEKVPNKIKKIKIHDVLRDLTFQISKKVRPYEDHFQANASWQHDETHYDKVVRISWIETTKFPVQISAPKLKVLLLDKSSVSEKFLSRSLPSLCSLQILSLRKTRIKYLPESLGELQHLVVLDLSFSEIKVLPFSLGKLKKLKVLNLHYCRELEKLPENVFLNLKSLKVLQLYGVGDLADGFSNNRDGFFDNQSGNLTGLTWFTFSSWSEEHLPLNLESMTELTILHMECPINDLEPLNKLNKLEELVVEGMLTRLPDWVCQCSSLTSLKITTGDPEAYYFPPLKALSRLRILHLDGWESLVSLPKLPCLEVLDIQNCNSLEGLLDPEKKGFGNLRKLSLEYCKKLCSIGNFPCLEVLDIQNCDSFEGLLDPEGKGFGNLRKLSLNYCEKLCSINGNFPKLKSLYAERCNFLIELPKCPCLEMLWIKDCNSLKRLLGPEEEVFSSLRYLSAKNCEELLSKLKSLEELTIMNCKSLKDLLDPEDDENCSLRALSVKDCEKLCSIGSLSKMKCLKSLKIMHCNTLKALSYSKDEGSCCLQELRIVNCKKLSSKGFGPFPKLKDLYITECDLFIKLPEAQAFPLVTRLVITDDLSIHELGIHFFVLEPRNAEIEIPKSWVVLGSLCNLEELEVGHFQRVKVPKLIAKGALPSLKHLLIGQVEVLPETEGSLPALESFGCSFQDGVIEIPDSFWQFLDNLPQLKFLSLAGNDIKSFEEWRSIQMPKTLSLGGFRCKRLPTSMGRKGSQFDSLEELTLHDLHDLETLPEVEASALPKLKTLNIHCRRLVIPEYYNHLIGDRTYYNEDFAGAT